MIFLDHCISQYANPTSFHYMKYVFILGQFVLGVGSSPLSILAVTMIDESVNQKVYPIHIGMYEFKSHYILGRLSLNYISFLGIFYLGALVGPAIGFILGGKLLTIYTNVNDP